VPINVVRRGFDGPVTLTVENVPEGLTVRSGVVLPGQANGMISLLAAPELDLPAVVLQVVGTGEGPGGPLQARGETMVTFASLAAFPTNIKAQRGLPASH